MSENKNFAEQMASLEKTKGAAFAKAFLELMEDVSYLKDDATATGQTATDFHGLGGQFADGRVERDIINTVLAAEGIDFEVRPTLTTDPVFSALIGYSDTTGIEPDESCEPGPTPGTMSFGHLMFPLGRKAFSSDTVDLAELWLSADRRDTRDLMLLGNYMPNSGYTPGSQPMLDNGQVFNSVINYQQSSLARAFAKWFGQTKWTGNPAGANAGYAEFWGLDNLIKTGYQDALDSSAMAAMDSYVHDFAGENMVTSTTKDIHKELSAMEAYLYFKARRQGLFPVEWQIVMHPEMWHVLTIVWPMLAYTQFAAAGTVPDNVTVNLDGRTNLQETNAMREGMYLIVNGRRYTVVLDDYVPMDRTTPTAPEGSIYMVPRSIQGGALPVTYWEHQDYRAIGNEIVDPITNHLRYWTDEGRFLWTVDQRLNCFSMHANTKPRLVFRTPQLAGRIDDIQITPIVTLPDPTA